MQGVGVNGEFEVRNGHRFGYAVSVGHGGHQGHQDPQCSSYGKALDIRPLGLSESQLDDLVSFLHALTMPVEMARPSTALP